MAYKPQLPVSEPLVSYGTCVHTKLNLLFSCYLSYVNLIIRPAEEPRREKEKFSSPTIPEIKAHSRALNIKHSIHVAWHQRMKYQLLQTHSRHWEALVILRCRMRICAFRRKEGVGRCNEKCCSKAFSSKRDDVCRECVQNLLHNLIHFSWGGEASLHFSSEPYPLTIALISLYKKLNKQPTDLCFNGMYSITFSRKAPSERNYVLRLPNTFKCYNSLRK